MSKKNKNKSRNTDSSVPIAEETSVKPKTPPTDDLLKEFKHLAIVIIFILALLAVINYYNEKAGILQSFTDKFYSLF